MKKFLFLLILFFFPLLPLVFTSFSGGAWRGAGIAFGKPMATEGGEIFPQNPIIDSLLYLLKNDKLDTNKVKHLNELGKQSMYRNPDTAIILGRQALEIITPLSSSELFQAREGVESNELKLLRANTLGNLGAYYYLKADYLNALDYYLKALKLDREVKNKKGISKRLGNIGNIYNSQGNYFQALDYYLRALKIDEELGNKNGIANHLSNVGSVYCRQGDYSKTLDYYYKAQKIVEELGLKNDIAAVLGNIGTVYCYKGDYSRALDYYSRALKIMEDLGNKNNCAVFLGNIGTVYTAQADYSNAIYYYQKALKIDEELSFKEGMVIHFTNIGSLYTLTGKFKEAEQFLNKAITLGDSIGTLDYLRQTEEALANLYDTTGQHELALVHYKKAMMLKDTIFSQESKKQLLLKEMSYEFDKKEALLKAEHDKEMAVAEAQKKKQQIIIWSAIAGLFFVAVFAGYIFRSLTITRRQKNIIELQKNEVLQQKEKIVDSIRYAQRIQKRILMEEGELQNYLPDSFIYYQPKDIVSGDFYWFSKVDDIIVIAAIDCTGYGVPGAFMSIIGNTLLNEIVNKKHKIAPSEILRLLNSGVYEALHQKKDGEFSVDGMVIALCSLDYKNKIIQYAGAKTPLYILSDNTIDVIPGDIHEIAGDGRITKIISPTRKEYTNHVIPIKNNMSIYLFSDGYINQLRRNDKEIFGEQRFEDILLSIQHLNMQQQKERLSSIHSEWKEGAPQIDDILVMGVKI